MRHWMGENGPLRSKLENQIAEEVSNPLKAKKGV